MGYYCDATSTRWGLSGRERRRAEQRASSPTCSSHECGMPSARPELFTLYTTRRCWCCCAVPVRTRMYTLVSISSKRSIVVSYTRVSCISYPPVSVEYEYQAEQARPSSGCRLSIFQILHFSATGSQKKKNNAASGHGVRGGRNGGAAGRCAAAVIPLDHKDRHDRF